VAKQSADSQRIKGMDVMQNILQAHPDISAIFAENDEMALGAIEAIAAAGKSDQVKVVGFDGTADALDAIKGGRMAASATSNTATLPFATPTKALSPSAAACVTSHLAWRRRRLCASASSTRAHSWR
jgi:ribose transport system substrate-binding protein